MNFILHIMLQIVCKIHLSDPPINTNFILALGVPSKPFFSRCHYHQSWMSVIINMCGLKQIPLCCNIGLGLIRCERSAFLGCCTCSIKHTQGGGIWGLLSNCGSLGLPMWTRCCHYWVAWVLEIFRLHSDYFEQAHFP